MNPEHAFLGPNRSLMEQLRAHSLACDIRDTALIMSEEEPPQGRIVCNRPRPGVISKSLGDGTACFWLYRDGSILFLGLWGGKLYEVPRAEETLQLADQILKGTNGTPWSLPPELIARFGLRLCDDLAVLPHTEAEDLQEALRAAFNQGFARDAPFRGFTLEAFVKAIGPVVDLCLVEADGLVRFIKGQASAFTRLRGGQDYQHRSVTVLFYDGLTKTEDHVALLQALQTRLNASLFDPAWENRIHLDDPYYAARGTGARPEKPRNAACADAPPLKE